MNAVGLGRIDDAHAFVRQGRAIKPDLSFELAQTCPGHHGARRGAEVLRGAARGWPVAVAPETGRPATHGALAPGRAFPHVLSSDIGLLSPLGTP